MHSHLGNLSLDFNASAAVQAQEDGWHFTFDLGSKRVNWNNARWAVAPLAQGLAGAGRLQFDIRTQHPRADLGVALALRTLDGCWYAHPWAAGLTAASTMSTIQLDDFRPAEWYAPMGGSHVDATGVLDPALVDSVAVGVIDPRGAGIVSFVLGQLQALPAEGLAAANVTISGQLLQVNGTTMIPPGAFGGYHLPAGHITRYRMGSSRNMEHTGFANAWSSPSEGEAFRINTVGDRVRPSPRLTHADWEAKSIAAATALGQEAEASGEEIWVEYWNEPYLNWSNRNRANFIPELFNKEAAKEGAPATISHDGTTVPHLEWTQRHEDLPWAWCSEKDWRRGIDAQGDQRSPVHAPPYKGMADIYGGEWTPSLHPPEECADGATYTVERDGETLSLTAHTPWHLVDRSQFTYWSGRSQVPLYTEPCNAYANALKAACPQAKLVVGWGMRPSEDHWAAWDMLYKPTIDATIAYADAICDHDYGGDPTKVAACYELACAYGMVRYNKWLYGVNTECASATDPQAVPGAGAQSDNGAGDYRKFIWTARKIVYHLATQADKVRNLCHFGYGGQWWSDTGDGVAFDLLRALRGSMLHSVSSSSDVLCVAALDGTDARCPRPDDLGAGTDLVVAILNNRAQARAVTVNLMAPQGCTILSRMLSRGVDSDAGMRLEVAGLAADDAVQVQLQAYEVQVIRCTLSGAPAAATVSRTQYFSDIFVQELTQSSPLASTITIPPADAPIQRAWLRLAQEHGAAGAVQCAINGHSLAIPACATPENGALLNDVLIDPRCLQESNQISLQLTHAAAMPARIVCASLIVER